MRKISKLIEKEIKYQRRNQKKVVEDKDAIISDMIKG
jgi:hypothetical protein